MAYGIGEGHASVVAEDDVEALVGQRHRFRAGVHEGEVHTGLGHETAGMLELLLGEVQAHRPGPGLGQGDGPLGCAAAQLQDVAALDVAQNLETGLGNLPDPPGQTPRGRQLRSVVGLVGVAVGVPASPILDRVLGERFRVQFRDIQHAVVSYRLPANSFRVTTPERPPNTRDIALW